MNKQERRQTQQLLDKIKFLRENLDPMFPLQHVQILLEAALDEGLSHKEMYRKLEPQSSASTNRGIKALSAQSWQMNADGTRRKSGKGLLRTDPDPLELRVKRITLTKDGQEFVKELSEI